MPDIRINAIPELTDVADVSDDLNLIADPDSGATASVKVSTLRTKYIGTRDVPADGTKLDTIATSADVSPVTSVLGRVGTISAVSGDYSSDQVSYDNTASGLAATDVKEAIDEVAASSGGGGSGDVVGPASATDNAVARFDATTGKLIQASGITIDDSNNLGGIGVINATGAISTAGTIGTSGTVSAASLVSTGNTTVNGVLVINGGATVGGGLIDGRDVATDGAKLDGIASSADVSPVTSVLGRAGVVVAVAGDYAASEVAFVADGDITATTTQAAIVEVRDDADTKLANKLPTSHAGTGGTAHADAISGGAAGFMTGADKARIDADLPQSNFTATVAPTPADDSSLGYSMGSPWTNSTTNLAYVMVEEGTGAGAGADWAETTAAGGGGGLTAPGTTTDRAIASWDGVAGAGLRENLTVMNADGTITIPRTSDATPAVADASDTDSGVGWTASTVRLILGGASRFNIGLFSHSSTKDILPSTDNSFDLGSATKRWAEVSTVVSTVGDLIMRRPAAAEDDPTAPHLTLVETVGGIGVWCHVENKSYRIPLVECSPLDIPAPIKSSPGIRAVIAAAKKALKS